MKARILYYCLCFSLLSSASVFAADPSLQKAKIDKANELEKYYQELNELDGSNINDYRDDQSQDEFDELSNGLEAQRQKTKKPSSNRSEKHMKDAFSEMDDSNK